MAKQVFTLDLDTRDLIKNYRKAIADMSNAGAKTSIVDGLTKQLDKLESQFNNLSSEGAFGLTGQKNIQNYTKRVTKAYGALGELGQTMRSLAEDNDAFPSSQLADFTKKLTEARNKVSQFQEAIRDAGNNLGINIDTDALESGQQNINELLKDELRTRQAIERVIQNVADHESQAVREQAASRGRGQSLIRSTDVNADYRSSMNLTTQDINVIRQDLNRVFAEGIRAGEDFQTVWQRAISSSFMGSEDELRNFVSDVDALSASLQTVIDRRDRAIEGLDSVQNANAATQAREQLGSADQTNPVLSTDAQNLINNTTNSLTQLAAARQEVTNAETREAAAQQANTITMQGLQDAADNLTTSTRMSSDEFERQGTVVVESANRAEQASAAFDGLKSSLFALLSISSAVNGLKKIVNDTLNDVKTLDKSFASIAMVTTKSVADMWASYGDYAKMASDLGQETNSVIQASALFYQQGLDTKEALALTTDTMKLATLAGNDFSTATEEMTSAIRGFKMEMEEGGHVTDVYSTLAANAAASVDDIAQAMARTASIANSAGMSFENTSAFLTQMIETTQESAENIGTSMKTIIARFTELKENVSATDSEFDDLDYNKVDKALKSVGVSLKDASGQFRNLDDVFLELSAKWNSLDRNTQRYVATIAAGSRQQSRFIAMMDNYDRTIELMDKAAESEGKADEQFAKYADTMEYKLNQLKTQWEEFRVNTLNENFFKGIIDSASTLMERLNKIKINNLFDAGKFGAQLLIAAKGFKNFAGIVLDSMRTTVANAARIGQQIGTNIKNKIIDKLRDKRGFNVIYKINPEVDFNRAQRELQQARTKLENLNSADPLAVRILTDFPEADLTEVETKYRQALDSMGYSTDQIDASWERFKNNLGNDSAEIQEGLEELRDATNEYNQASDNATQAGTRFARVQQKNTAVSQLASSALNSAMMAISGLTSGLMTGEEAAVAFRKSMLSMCVQVAVQAVSTSLATVMANKTAEMSYWDLAKAEWATLWPIGLIIIAIAALTVAISGIIILISKYANTMSEAAQAAQNLKDAENDVAEAKSRMNESKSDESSAKKELKDAQELQKEYKQLNQLRLAGTMTEEQSERYNEIVEQIKEELPEIVKSYNEQNGALEVQMNLWDQIIDKQEQAANKASAKALSDTLVYYQAESDLVDRQTEKTMMDLGQSATFTQGVGSYKTTRTLQEQIAEGKDADNHTHLGGDDSARKLTSKEVLQSYEEKGKITSLNEIAKYFGEDTSLFKNEADWDRLFEKMSDESNEGWQIISDTCDNVNEEAERQKNLYKDAMVTSTAETLAEESGEDSAVARAAVLSINSELNKYTAAQFKNSTDMRNDLDYYEWFNGYEYDNFNAEQQEAVQRIVGSTKSSDIDKYLKNIEADSDSEEQFLEDMNEALTEIFMEKANQSMKDMDESLKQSIIDFNNSSNLTEADMREAYVDLMKAYFESDSVDTSQLTDNDLAMYQAMTEQFNSSLEARNNLIDTITGKLDGITKTSFSDWTTSDLETLNAAVQRLNDSYGELVGKNYGTEIEKLGTNLGLNADQISQIMAIDWSQLSLDNEDEFKEKYRAMLADVGVDIETFYDKVKGYAEENNLIDLSMNTEEAFEEFKEEIEDTIDKIQALGDNIVDITKDITETGEVSFSNFESLSKSLKDLGLSVYDYVNIDKNGTITADQEALEQLYKDQLEAQREKINRQIAENNAKKAEIQLQMLSLDAANSQVKAGGDAFNGIINNRDATMDWANAMQAVANEYARITGGEVEKTKVQIDFTVGEDDTFDSEAYEKAVESQRLALQTQYDNLTEINKSLIKEQNNLVKYNNAANKDMQKRLLEARGGTADVAKAQEDYNKALEDYNNALEDVADKQEALNEKLKEYNELLYGEDNRKSTLDSLYNYDEAINSFNDEISRSKDILADSKSIDESTAALARYAKATHNLLAEEKAKQQVIEAGLKNYADMIENGGTSYQNSETGETISVNFGDYAKKDERTGKYIIDQRLLNQAKFNDKYKDLIEQNVSDYNKYVDEMLKSEDNVRKAEKELQDERNAALDKYVAMETEIAEALKEKYEEEVNNLKDKYDSMKDADDDYLDALQDAIDKQRKLREQDKAFEDLARQEKKLSLMQRDTSGANQIETQQLEKEVQETREDLLNDSIDRVIENLEKLYEKQDELRQEEIELKEALTDNTAFWNAQAEQIAGSFTSTEEYMEYMSQLSTEFANMTLAQQQQKLNEYGKTYTEASEYMAMQAMDTASETGDFVVDTMTITGEEVQNIVTETAQTFSDEVIASYNRTTDAFNEDLKKAEDEIDNAKQALQDAINKLNECAQAANEAAEALANARAARTGEGSVEETEDNLPDTLSGFALNAGGNSKGIDDITNKMSGLDEAKALVGTITGKTKEEKFKNLLTSNGLTGSQEDVEKVLERLAPDELYGFANWLGASGTAMDMATRNVDKNSEEYRHRIAKILSWQKFADGGIVNYTGPAWVDGTPSQPEAFLNPQDTERIGNAAKILADIPWIDRETDNSSVVTNNAGDVSVEINLNIDHITSDIDIDEMLDRVKEEIVEVARPAGTNTILQQQL